MQKQRTLFFGKISKKSPKKDGTNLPVSKRRFGAISPQDIDIHFTNTTVTQFGGYALWDSFLKRFGLDAKLAQHINDIWGQRPYLLFSKKRTLDYIKPTIFSDKN